MALPVAPEDGGTVSDVLPPYMYNMTTLAGGSAIRVTWKTDERSKSRIEYGTTTGYGSELVDNTLQTTHVLQISGLEQFDIVSPSRDHRDRQSAISASTTAGHPEEHDSHQRRPS